MLGLSPVAERPAISILCRTIQDDIFNFALHREPQAYTLITARRGRTRSPEESSCVPFEREVREKRKTV